MNEKDYTDDDLEEELNNAYKESEKKTNVFKIIRNEKNAMKEKERRVKVKFNLNKNSDD
jgi:hypothetical protein